MKYSTSKTRELIVCQEQANDTIISCPIFMEFLSTERAKYEGEFEHNKGEKYILFRGGTAADIRW